MGKFSAAHTFLGKPWVAIVLILAFVLWHVYSGNALSVINENVSGMKILDVRHPFNSAYPPWNGEEAAILLEKLGEKGRGLYLSFNIYADFPFSVLLMPLFFLSMLSLFYDSWLILVGLFPAIFDILENICVIMLLQGYPAQTHFAVEYGPYFTWWKFACLLLTLAVLLIGAIIKLAQVVRGQSDLISG